MSQTIGLTSQQAAEEMRRGNGNTQEDHTQKTVGGIIRENVFTYFNLIFLILTILLIVSGNFRGLTFLPVIVANTLIGIIQEIYAKSVLDKLSILHAPSAEVIRDGNVNQVPIDQLVLHDVIILKSGAQIPADAVVIQGELSVNEALLTGEADEITKKPGDGLMSGSFVVSGNAYAQLTQVGENSYLSKLTREAREMPAGEQSEMVRSINRLVMVMGILLIPLGVTLFVQGMYWRDTSFQSSVSSMVAVVLGMIPEGLYLLVSVTLAMSAARLALKKVMLHDMKSIEALARVDVLCVDKTGTITDTKMLVADCTLPGVRPDILLPDEEGQPGRPRPVEEKLSPELVNRFGSYIQSLTDDNITMQAIRDYFPSNGSIRAVEALPFTSRNKYSAVRFQDGVYIFPWKGDKIMYTIVQILRAYGIKARKIGSYIFASNITTIQYKDTVNIINNSPAPSEEKLAARISNLEHDKFDKYLTKELQCIQYGYRNFDVSGAMEFFKNDALKAKTPFNPVNNAAYSIAE